MKKIIFLCLAAFLSTGIFASSSPSSDPSNEILKIFNHDFPDVSNYKMSLVDGYYIIHFQDEENSSSCSVYYDSKGNMAQTIKYYSADELSPFIRAKINASFKGKEITNVSEVTNNAEHYYQIILQDSKSMFIVNSNVNGTLHLEKKYKRG